MLPTSITILSTKVLGTGKTEVTYKDQDDAVYTVQLPDDSNFERLILGV